MVDRVRLPAWPTPSGPSPQKERFFAEVALGMEILALYHALPLEAQQVFIDTLRALSVQEAQRRVTE